MLDKFGMETLKDALDKDIEEWTQRMIQEQEAVMAQEQAAMQEQEAAI